ncbi:MAG: hypothetical protein QXF49_01275 [Thermosphaera sp.]
MKSICVNDGTVTLTIKNLGYECHGFLSIRLVELLDEPEKQKHFFGLVTTTKRLVMLASHRVPEPPIEETREVTLQPKSKLQKGHKYKLVICSEHKTYDYDFTINDSGNIILTYPSTD